MVTIRIATPADRAVLTDFARRTFYETFAAQNTPENMQAYLDQAFNDAQQAAELSDPARITLLAEHAGRVVGYAQLHQTAAPACVTERGAIELVRLYVDRNSHGQGVARELMREVELVAAERAAAIWLGVWEHNPRAKAFYRKCGFVDVGAHDFTLGTDVQTDHIMMKPLPVHTASSDVSR